MTAKDLVDELSDQVRLKEAELARVEAQNEALFSLVDHLRQCSGCHGSEWCPQAMVLWRDAISQ